MAEATKIYSLKEYTFNVFGLDFSKGQASEGDTFSLSYPNEYVTMQSGNDGSVVFSENPAAFHAEGILRLQQTSALWAQLWAAVGALRASGGVLTGPLLIKDGGGSQAVACGIAAPKNLPGTNVGKDSQPREIVFHMPNTVEIGGGN
jgi:hypothetical protein